MIILERIDKVIPQDKLSELHEEMILNESVDSDIEHLIGSQLIIYYQHMSKFILVPEKQSESWINSIKGSANTIEENYKNMNYSRYYRKIENNLNKWFTKGLMKAKEECSGYKDRFDDPNEINFVRDTILNIFDEDWKAPKGKLKNLEEYAFEQCSMFKNYNLPKVMSKMDLWEDELKRDKK